MKPFMALVGLAFGLWLGISLADFDQHLFFLQHRSLITHSVLPALVGLFIPRHVTWARMLVIGVCVGMAVHLSFDLFPQNWLGYALINAPFFGRLPAAVSVLWIIGNLVACLVLALFLIDQGYEVPMAGAGMLIAFLACAQDERTFWLPLLTLVFLLAITLLLPTNTSGFIQTARQRLKV